MGDILSARRGRCSNGFGREAQMQAVGACMRKRVMLCYEALKNRQTFDPRWASRIAA